jgi:hypothetical protein
MRPAEDIVPVQERRFQATVAGLAVLADIQAAAWRMDLAAGTERLGHAGIHPGLVGRRRSSDRTRAAAVPGRIRPAHTEAVERSIGRIAAGGDRVDHTAGLVGDSQSQNRILAVGRVSRRPPIESSGRMGRSWCLCGRDEEKKCKAIVGGRSMAELWSLQEEKQWFNSCCAFLHCPA